MNDDRLDLLTGYTEIGSFLNWPPRRVRHRALSGDLPMFKVGHHTCARRSTLRDWAARTEAEGLRSAPRHARAG